jgi:hypothetical protein
MRKIHLNSGVVQDHAQQLLDDMHTVGNYIEAIEMFIVNPGPNCDATVKEALIHVQKQLDKVKGYMGMMKVNSARLPVGGEANSDDTAFLEDADSILGLENGESIDLSKAQLLYNPDTLKLMLTDEADIPDGFEVVGTVVETEDTENAAEDAEDKPEDTAEDTADNAAGGEDAGIAEDISTAEEPAEGTSSEEKPAEEPEGGIF